MRAVVTVIGKDKVGIIAKVSGALSELSLNVEDISQTILQGFFVMMMLVGLPGPEADLAAVQRRLSGLGDSLGVQIRIQHEDIFNAMHRI